MVVFEDQRIVHVGQRFDGEADRRIDATGMLVMPGLINTHLHLGTNAPHAFFLDHTKADYFGANFYAYSVPRRGAAESRATARPEVEQRYHAEVQRRMRGTVWSTGCVSWYQDAQGRITWTGRANAIRGMLPP